VIFATVINKAPHGEVPPECGLVSTTKQPIDPCGRLPVLQASQQALPGCRAIGLGHQRYAIASDQSFNGSGEHFGHALIRLCDPAISVDQEDRHTGCIEYLLEQRLALAQRLKEAIEAPDQLSDFVVPDNRQGMRRVRGIGHLRQ